MEGRAVDQVGLLLRLRPDAAGGETAPLDLRLGTTAVEGQVEHSAFGDLDFPVPRLQLLVIQTKGDFQADQVGRHGDGFALRPGSTRRLAGGSLSR